MKTTLTARKKFTIGEISPRLFGSFVEHMGSVVYTGIYEPGHATADENGFRQDVMKLINELDLGVIRYPGGNFTSGYDWKDTIGPIEKRPRKIDIAWRAIEPNTFGIHEFMKWVEQTGAEPIFTINLGTKGIDDARDIVEYCNFSGGTYWSDLRQKNGAAEPFGIKLWCLGNELDGPWQIGTKQPEEYGRLANEAAKAMKWVDDTIETVLVGSSTPRLSSYPEWDRLVLEAAYENVDYLALHNYIDKYDEDDLTRPPKTERDDTPTYLAKSKRFDRQIEEIVATCDYVKALKRSDKTMYLAFDEWNVHAQPEKENQPFEVGSPIDWCQFTMEDTLLFGSLGLAILRHADRVKIGCQSLLVNTIPLILTDAGGDCWVNPTYYVMEQLSNYAKGEVLQTQFSGPTYDVDKMKQVECVDTCLVNNEEELVLFLVNRSEEEQLVEVDHDFEQKLSLIEHRYIGGYELQDKNSRDNQKHIQPQRLADYVTLDDGKIEAKIPGYSWNMLRMKK
ncbi:alpha-N-arabinofuranosidase [Enterococcus sp.]|uniref:alpha-N-arabinofuranosidase n=1 Tax=Enterococcus sp. TaxID=35783 RepID=UPI00290C304A|nr:alpha-L-arabinofuranosidase C-terminal domain-containing protein [Enterococcus sp.]MDU5336518.1 alpha-L-arabinofuranosidase C-terminal domain-containing protein [Enterococcus sp.]